MYNLIVYTVLRNDLSSDGIKYSKPINAKIVSFRIHVRAEQPAGPAARKWRVGGGRAPGRPAMLSQGIHSQARGPVHFTHFSGGLRAVSVYPMFVFSGVLPLAVYTHTFFDYFLASSRWLYADRFR